MKLKKLTLVDLYVRPNIFSLAYHSPLAPVQASLNRHGNLNGVRVGSTEVEGLASSDAING